MDTARHNAMLIFAPPIVVFSRESWCIWLWRTSTSKQQHSPSS